MCCLQRTSKTKQWTSHGSDGSDCDLSPRRAKIKVFSHGECFCRTLPCKSALSLAFLEQNKTTLPKFTKQNIYHGNFFLFISLKKNACHDRALPYQVWLQKAERFQKYLPDKARAHELKDTVIPDTTLQLCYGRHNLITQPSHVVTLDVVTSICCKLRASLLHLKGQLVSARRLS